MKSIINSLTNSLYYLNRKMHTKSLPEAQKSQLEALSKQLTLIIDQIKIMAENSQKGAIE